MQVTRLLQDKGVWHVTARSGGKASHRPIAAEGVRMSQGSSGSRGACCKASLAEGVVHVTGHAGSRCRVSLAEGGFGQTGGMRVTGRFC